MDFCSFLTSTAATVLGGIILALLVFWVREKLCPIPDINGRWYFQKKTLETAYNRYRNMVLQYEVILWREGTIVRGTAEKAFEDAENRTIEYIGKDRTRGHIEGFIQKNYLGKDRIFLHIIEKGQERESSTYHELTFKSKSELVGQFSSMVAKQSGEVTWQRNPF